MKPLDIIEQKWQSPRVLAQANGGKTLTFCHIEEIEHILCLTTSSKKT